MNMMRIFYIGLSGVGMMFSSMASGHDAGGLQSPACGVVCDPYIFAVKFIFLIAHWLNKALRIISD